MPVWPWFCHITDTRPLRSLRDRQGELERSTCLASALLAAVPECSTMFLRDALREPQPKSGPVALGCLVRVKQNLRHGGRYAAPVVRHRDMNFAGKSSHT